MINKLINSINKQPNIADNFAGVNRTTLKVRAQNALSSKNPQDYIDTILAILRWGGIRNSFYPKAEVSLRANINKVISALNIVDIEKRFDAFKGLISCVGPSFFTKIIHFFDPENTIILDKWISLSLFAVFNSGNENVLDADMYGYFFIYSKSKNLVNISKYDYRITGKTYLQAIADTKKIQYRLKQSFSRIFLEDVERAMFSVGRGKGIWRKDLIAYMETLGKTWGNAKGYKYFKVKI